MPLQIEDVVGFVTLWKGLVSSIHKPSDESVSVLDGFMEKLLNALKSPILDDQGSPDQRLSEVADALVSTIAPSPPLTGSYLFDPRLSTSTRS
jgi:hypothetical protein